VPQSIGASFELVACCREDSEFLLEEGSVATKSIESYPRGVQAVLSVYDEDGGSSDDAASASSSAERQVTDRDF